MRSFTLALTLVLACGDSADMSAMPEGSECEQGTAYTCFGRGGCRGRQTCVAGALSRCMCTDDPMTSPDVDASMQPGDAGQTLPDASVVADASVDAGPAARDADPEPEDAAASDANAPDADAPDAGAECPAGRCVESAPADWSGPVALYVGSDAPPSCGGDYAQQSLQANGDLSAAAAQCSACSCAPGSCAGWLVFSISGGSDCGDPACLHSVNNACVSVGSPCLEGQTSAFLEPQLPGGGSACTASQQSPTLPAPTWQQRVLGCAPDAVSQRDCVAGQLCAPPAPPTPFGAQLCIHRAGDHACPSGAYSERQLFHQGVEDTRSCSACSCADGCSYQWRVYDNADTACATPLLTLTSEGQCASVSASAGSVRVGATIAGDGTCASSGGQPQGGVSEASPITVCCMP